MLKIKASKMSIHTDVKRVTTHVLQEMKLRGEKISMLVAKNDAVFSKKAKGRINFSCIDGAILDTVIKNAITTKEGQLINLRAIGLDSVGDEVASFNFNWTLKLKNK